MEYRIDLPKNVKFIIKLLEQEGHEAFSVGGCVRDALMGREPQDWDITTSAAPLDVKKIFHKTIDTGLQHGTVTVMLDKVGYEVTTYRIDGNYSDGRHPDQVLFTKNLVEDLKRRDFTINAMAYNDRVGVVDEFDGIGDLQRKIIKCVGNPVERFTEDALRMLRAVRFAAKLGFDIDETTATAIREMAPSIKKISKERIQSELNKLITSDNPQVLAKVFELGMAQYILEGSVLVECVADVSACEMYQNIIEVMKNTAPDHYLRWAAFMMYEGSGCRAMLKVLKFDNKTINICGKLVENIGYFADFEDKSGEVSGTLDILAGKKYLIRKLLVDMSPEIFDEYYMPFLRAVVACGDNDVNESVEGHLTMEILDEIEAMFSEIITNGDCIAKNQMSVKGADLKEAGVEPGKVMGEVIDRMFEAILKDPTMNEKSKLLKMIE